MLFGFSQISNLLFHILHHNSQPELINYKLEGSLRCVGQQGIINTKYSLTSSSKDARWIKLALVAW